MGFLGYFYPEEINVVKKRGGKGVDVDHSIADTLYSCLLFGMFFYAILPFRRMVTNLPTDHCDFSWKSSIEGEGALVLELFCSSVGETDS